MTITLAPALAGLALALGIARLVMFIALHLVPSDYNIVQHAVSDYAVGPTHRLATAVTWTSAVFWAVLAGAIALGPSTPEKGVTLWLAVLALFLLVVVVASVIFGVRAVTLDDALAALTGQATTAEQAAAVARLPRTVLGLLAGASLAIAGGTMQAVTRNPLADPGIFGVLSGASLAVAWPSSTSPIPTRRCYSR